MKKSKIIALLLAVVITAGSMIACTTNKDNGSSTTSVEQTTKKKAGQVKTVYEAVKTAYGDNYYPSMALDSAILADKYGIKADLVKEVVAEGPMTTMNVDTFIVAEGKDEASAKEIETALNAYKQDAIKNATKYPKDAPRYANALVKRVDDYVFFAILGGMFEYSDINYEGMTEEEISKKEAELQAKETAHYVEQMKKAEEAINSSLK